jgi:hypothetical protein
MKGARSDEHDKPTTRKPSDNDGAQPDDTRREGPPRIQHELDRGEEWDRAAEHKGYQPPGKGGYKGDYDTGKYENRDFGFPQRDDNPRDREETTDPGQPYTEPKGDSKRSSK